MADEEGGGFLDSFKGMLIGLVLIPVSFFLVYRASQRPQASEDLVGSFPVAQKSEATAANKGVYATGKIQAAPIGDSPFVKPGKYLSLRRSGEVYTYVERSRSKGSGDNKKKEYYCELDWTSSPSDSNWHSPGCRGNSLRRVTNQDRSIDAQVSLVADGKTFRMGQGIRYYDFPGISLTQADVLSGTLSGDDTIYPDASCAGSPRNGCQRVSYSGESYDPAAEHTVIGDEKGGTFVKYQDNHLVMGIGDYATTMKTVDSADTAETWMWFIGSVLCFGGGLVLLVGPLLKLIEYIPLIGGFGANVIRFIFFAFAFFFMGITFLLIEFWYVVIALFVIGAIAIFMLARKRQAAAGAT